MSTSLSRRQLLATGLAAGTGLAISSPSTQAESGTRTHPKVRYCLNASTIREERKRKTDIVEQVEVAAKAGYDGIEVWMRDLAKHKEAGHSLKDLGKKISDAGLTVDSAIGFARWIVDDNTARAKGLEDAKRDMDMLKQVGGSLIAAPPVGATNQTDLNLFAAAERYRKLLEVGDDIGVVAQVEVWGFSKSLSRLGETAFVAIESGHPKACILPDVYHIYKGGSDFNGLRLLAGTSVHCFHVNDYPADPPRETINDAKRVYPGDGVAPLTQIYQTMWNNGFTGTFSLELFNPIYWQEDALTVAKTGLEKMKASVTKAANA